ncbi:replication initiator protein RctB domain-containing protein [Marinimicrobium sp. ABcell2]|uniref:replication initiator protein RctB domain-containing protein n=1 Tax=Marinimicrobium sp. ABcell2 TaxID=3069751 RepID=UPI0027B32D41|nr:replication initiator protein RctB domain-containing protein [Marinimicrobium sp. ABcell2]MDQ2077414.1 hypothetical protein [Marinimicrobium sp. ABcell2]
MDIPEFTYTSPIFCVPENADDQLRTYMKLLQKANDREFVLSVITAALEYGVVLPHSDPIDRHLYLDYDQLKVAVEKSGTKLALGLTSLRTRLARLCDMELFSAERLNTPQLRGYRNAFTLQSPTALVRSGLIQVDSDEPQFEPSNKRDKTYYAATRKARQSLTSQEVQVLESPKELKRAHSERLLNNVFFGCGRLSSRDPRRRKIVTLYPFKGETVEITATAGGESDLFSLEDQNTVLAIITLVINTHYSKTTHNIPLSSIPNEYFLDICALAEVCGLDPNGANRNTLRKSLDRLYHSNLHVQCSKDSVFAQHFGLYSSMGDGREFHPDDLNFRFLSALDAVSESDPDIAGSRRPRYYRISLHSMIHKQLLDKDVWSTFVVDPELVRNRLRLITHLYFFAARMIHRDRELVRSYPIETVQSLTMPAHTRFDNWRRSLFNELKKFAIGQGTVFDEKKINVLELFGYFVKIAPDHKFGFTFTFWFNPNHPVLGCSILEEKSLSQRTLDLRPPNK